MSQSPPRQPVRRHTRWRWCRPAGVASLLAMPTTLRHPAVENIPLLSRAPTRWISWVEREGAVGASNRRPPVGRGFNLRASPWGHYTKQVFGCDGVRALRWARWRRHSGPTTSLLRCGRGLGTTTATEPGEVQRLQLRVLDCRHRPPPLATAAVGRRGCVVYRVFYVNISGGRLPSANLMVALVDCPCGGCR